MKIKPFASLAEIPLSGVTGHISSSPVWAPHTVPPVVCRATLAQGGATALPVAGATGTASLSLLSGRELANV